MHLVSSGDSLQIKPKRGKDKRVQIKNIPVRNRATAGKNVCGGILEVAPDKSVKGEIQ
jgi:hypothetical protein